MNLIDVPGDPAFQGELRCAARVVEGALVTVSAVMGVETIGRMKGLSPRATPHRDGKVTYPPLYDLPYPWRCLTAAVGLLRSQYDSLHRAGLLAASFRPGKRSGRAPLADGGMPLT